MAGKVAPSVAMLLAKLPCAQRPNPAAWRSFARLASLPQFLIEGREGIMFQMIDESKVATPEDRKLFWYKVGLFLVVAAAFGGVIYFFAFVPYKG